MNRSRRSWRAGIRVLFDTQALILANLGLLPNRLQRLLAPVSVEVCLSTVSLVEIAVKNTIGKLEMPEALVSLALRDLHISTLPFDARHAMRLFSLPLHHRDPFDRMILATAVEENLPIVTGDRVFRRYSGIEILW